MSRTPLRAAVVGTGHRAQTFTRGLAARPGHVVALCDPNPARMAFHNRLLTAEGEPAATTWEPGRFADLLAEEDIEEVVVTTVDAAQGRYVVPALKAACRVVTEKPMTVDAERCARILDTVRATGNPLTVAFNYRFNPVTRRCASWRGRRSVGPLRALRVAPRHPARRRLLPPPAPREGQQRRPDGPHVESPLRPRQLVARGRAAGRLRLRAAWLPRPRRGRTARTAPGLRARPRRPAGGRRPLRPGPGRRRHPAPSTPTPSGTTGACATATSSADPSPSRTTWPSSCATPAGRR
jgi:hypothetical protein